MSWRPFKISKLNDIERKELIEDVKLIRGDCIARGLPYDRDYYTDLLSALYNKEDIDWLNKARVSEIRKHANEIKKETSAKRELRRLLK